MLFLYLKEPRDSPRLEVCILVFVLYGGTLRRAVFIRAETNAIPQRLLCPIHSANPVRQPHHQETERQAGGIDKHSHLQTGIGPDR